jgi:hypothetical protein
MPNYLEKHKNRFDQVDFLRNRMYHLHFQLNNSVRENCERETLLLLHETVAGHHSGLAGLPNEDLTRLKCLVKMKIKKIKEHLRQLGIEEGQTLQEAPVQPMFFSSQQQVDHTYTMLQTPLQTKA